MGTVLLITLFIYLFFPGDTVIFSSGKYTFTTFCFKTSSILEKHKPRPTDPLSWLYLVSDNVVVTMG